MNGHFVPFLVVLCFSIVQTFLNNIPEGNLLESVHNTLKIAFTFKPVWYAKAVSAVAYDKKSEYTHYTSCNIAKFGVLLMEIITCM